jgi:hypothetical protein
MMIAGCFGLLAAAAETLPNLTETVSKSMREAGIGRPPWEID